GPFCPSQGRWCDCCSRETLRNSHGIELDDLVGVLFGKQQTAILIGDAVIVRRSKRMPSLQAQETPDLLSWSEHLLAVPVRRNSVLLLGREMPGERGVWIAEFESDGVDGYSRGSPFFLEQVQFIFFVSNLPCVSYGC